ncbi:hypothetical protein M5W98_29820, partial [Paenibacillus apiarius]|nr:hypothetical protein [Paenibacillus apiarius]
MTVVAVSVAVIRPERSGCRREMPDGIGAPGRDRTGDISLTSSVHRIRTRPGTASSSGLRLCQ